MSKDLKRISENEMVMRSMHSCLRFGTDTTVVDEVEVEVEVERLRLRISNAHRRESSFQRSLPWPSKDHQTTPLIHVSQGLASLNLGNLVDLRLFMTVSFRKALIIQAYKQNKTNLFPLAAIEGMGREVRV